MSNAALVQDETEDRYFTQVEEGDVRLFTLDQLDAAFNAGLIHENTYLCLEGDSKWLTLAEVAGLGDDDEEPVSAPHLIAAPAPQAPTPMQRAYVPAVHAAVDPFGMAPITSVPPSMNSIAPVANSVAPMSQSFAPTSAAFDDDFEMMAMRRKRPFGKILAGVAVLGMAGVAFAVVQSGGVRLPTLGENVAQASAASLSVSNLKAAEPVHTAAPVVPTPAAEAPQAEAPKTDDAKPSDSTDTAKKTGDDRFSEDMKAALLNKDKSTPSSKKTSKKAGRAVAATAHRPAGKAKSGGGLKSSGNAYDPLNGKL